MSLLDDIDWWLEVVNKFINEGGQFAFPLDIHSIAQFKNDITFSYKNTKQAYTCGLMMFVNDQGIARPM